MGSITVNPSAQAILKSPSSSQIVCDSSALVDIQYDIIGSTSITTLPSSNNPSWLNSNFVGGELTLSGTPGTSSEFEETYTYQYALIGSIYGCVSGSPTPTLSGTITVSPDQLIALDAASGSTSQTICEGNSIDPILVEFYGSSTGVNVTGLPAGIDANPSTLRTSIRELTITQPPGILTTTGSETYRIRINGNTYTYAAPALTAGVNSSTLGTNLAAFLDGVGGVTFGATFNTSSGTILISHKTPGLSLNVSHNNENESFVIENRIRRLDYARLI